MKYFTIIATVFCVALIPASALAGCGKYRSLPSSQPIDIKFENKTGGKVNVIWYNFHGGTVNYQTLGPTQSYVQATFTNHVWKFTTAKGKCLSSFVAKHSQTFVIR
jgi:VHL beta domain